MRTLAGAGIHTGALGRVEMTRRTPADGDTAGVRFRIGDRLLAPADLAQLPRAARRATVLGEGEGALHTPEHLLAALLFFAGEPLDVRIEGPEVPNLDGSALPFREALATLAPERAATPAWREYPCRLSWEHAWAGGHIRVEPAERFAVTYELEQPSLSQRVRISSPAEAWEGVLPARTWITRREWEEGRAQGLLRGAGAGSGLLLAGTWEEHRGSGSLRAGWPAGPYPLINHAAWRMDGEPVRHKVLDLLGDLALAGLALPALSIETKNGGHRAHQQLLRRLNYLS